MTTIDNSYCVPRTVEERSMFPHLLTEEHFGVYCDCTYGVLCFDEGDWIHENGTEIPISHFLDLMHDRIVPWRLEEVGFKPWPNSNTPASMLWENEAQYTIEVIFESVYVNSASFNVPTFTDLLTLIRMLTPPSND